MMRNFWKSGSRWSDDGDPATSVLDIFRHNQCVFVGKPEQWLSDRGCCDGDVFVITDGRKVVALGLVIDAPQPLTKLGVEVTEAQRKIFDPVQCRADGDACGVRVKWRDLLPEDVWQYANPQRICQITDIEAQNKIHEQVKKYFK